ncbi:unnamed protein product [Nippostrongylus brasiliensis]|uniref:Uncharacterized protein n=1 Tax=Nippostrongylus brasiliensis TaxID=27835 RepID=A0A0N4YP57_NIPBR|nr:unnamed protein product [Nippostrongylus brasiliensis]
MRGIARNGETGDHEEEEKEEERARGRLVLASSFNDRFWLRLAHVGIDPGIHEVRLPASRWFHTVVTSHGLGA